MMSHCWTHKTVGYLSWPGLSANYGLSMPRFLNQIFDG